MLDTNFPSLMKSKKLPSQEAEQKLRGINTERVHNPPKKARQQNPESKKENNELPSTEEHQYD